MKASALVAGDGVTVDSFGPEVDLAGIAIATWSRHPSCTDDK